MAAKKSKSSKKSNASSEPTDGVTVLLDSDTILTLKAAVEALSEFATAMTMASDDPTVRGTAKKRAKKRASKRA